VSTPVLVISSGTVVSATHTLLTVARPWLYALHWVQGELSREYQVLVAETGSTDTSVALDAYPTRVTHAGHEIASLDPLSSTYSDPPLSSYML
jgi:hypothetical protein